jgi:hypothetical protein
MKSMTSIALRMMSSIVAMSLFGCSHATERALDQKQAAETSVKSPDDLNHQADRLIGSAKGLTSEQREKLEALKVKVEFDVKEIRDESIRLRSILLSDVMNPAQYNQKEVNLIKRKMRRAEDRRINVLFDAVAKANTILGRITEENSPEMHRVFDMVNPTM